MKLLFFLVCFVYLSSSFTLFHPGKTDYASLCVGCTGVIGVIQNLAIYQKIPVVKIMSDFCALIPDDPKWDKFRKYCFDAVQLFGPLIAHYLELDVSPDRICNKLGMCKGFEQCVLWPNRTTNVKTEPLDRDMEDLTFDLKESIYEWSNPSNRDPIPPSDYDVDGDYFSTDFYDRGSAWRGKDCNDKDNQVYPGRKEGNTGDYNCNGIKGVDSKGQSYEEKLCGGSDRRGTIGIGDSACAHFRIPPVFLSKDVTVDMFKYVFPIIENEADWPQYGTVAGYMNDTTGLCPGVVSPKSSGYLDLRERNRCNHRDYQTVCVNGASSRNVMNYAKYVARNSTTDHVVNLVIALIGNDVCSWTHDYTRYTPPKEFHDNIIKLLKFLDTKLPKGSHVTLSGFADGGFLYKYLHNKTHPLGVSYEVVYDYLNCLYISPCWGYMSNDPQVRKKTAEWALSLSEEYKKIEANEKFQNFKVYYVDFTLIQSQILKEWIEAGIDPSEMGFHPSEKAIPYFKKLVDAYLYKKDPEIVGKVNPNNEEIIRLFGDQGGH